MQRALEQTTAPADGWTGSRKPVLVFVHGFGSDVRCWDPLLKHLRADPAITSRYEFERLPYPTKWLEIRPWQRIPSLREAADKLKNFLDSERFRDRSVILIGHSQGGLVIHAFLAQLLEAGEAHRLEPVRQVITLATPHLGSTFLSWLRRLFYRVFGNSQERGLCVLDPETARIVGTVKQRAAEADAADGRSWPVPVHCFGGLQDNIVLPASAQGPFASYKSISGDHFAIYQPETRRDDRYRELAEVLLDPGGHPHVFEIERYTTRIAPQPVPLQTFRLRLGDDNVREIATDNVCELTRTVRLARSNRCRGPFKIRYLSFAGSAFEARPSHENEAGQLAGEYEQSGGTKLDFLFTPAGPGEEYELALTIYNGFGEGRRDVHFHLGPPSVGGMAHYRKLTYELDLRAYLEAGWTVTATPALYWHPRDPGNCKGCKDLRRHRERLIAPAAGEGGVWRWELADVRGGVTDVFWDVAPGER